MSSTTFIPQLEMDSNEFPDPRKAEAGGIVAWGGDLGPERLIEAYRRGIFPWYMEGDPILWWSPDPRLLLYPADVRVNRSFRRVLRHKEYTVRFDHDFSSVIASCSAVRKKGEGTWLTGEMIHAYTELHRMGICHSVEVYMESRLAGGLYGVSLGNVFFGESMFSNFRDASKIALKALSDVLSEKGYDFIDCQVVSSHLLGMGAVKRRRDEFLAELESSMEKKGREGLWADVEWEYSDG
jgi:leucyl/phenylalanyl-tRNA--protein transferase